MSQTSCVRMLQAGPVSLKFQDGELRYLYVGDKEIVRRIYFAARNKNFDTAMPEFRRMDVQAGVDHFTISLDAVCRSVGVDFSWRGEITGTPDGTITFHVTGEAGMPFPSPRIGLCILFGVESLAGQAFDTVDVDGQRETGIFCQDVSPDFLVSNHFNRLHYCTEAGMDVTLDISGRGSGMEDQRNYCDSSYKAYHSLDYPYPEVPSGEARSDTLTLHVRNAPPQSQPVEQVHVAVGEALPGKLMPVLLPAEASNNTLQYYQLNENRAQYQHAPVISWLFNPVAHLSDDDTLMENVSSIIDQVRTVRTVRTYAPEAKIRLDPISFECMHPRPARDPRNTTPFAAAWAAALMACTARAGVDEAVFTLAAGPADAVLQVFQYYQGHQVLAVEITAHDPFSVQALAVEASGKTILWLTNMAAEPQIVSIDSTGSSIPLEPYEVRQIHL
ncbi:MAG: hypothetical protein ACYDBB_19900 [Armatimonadota bacterium]